MVSKNNYAKKLPSAKYLNEIFTYKDGYLYYKNYRSRVERGPNLEGKIAGHVRHNNDRYMISIYGSWYVGSRIIWKMLKGKDPEYIVDHKDGNCSNDRIENLQDISMSSNQRNVNRKMNSNNKTGEKGLERISQQGYKYWRARHAGICLYTGNDIEIARERLKEARENDPLYYN